MKNSNYRPHCNKCGCFIGENHICKDVWHKGTKGIIKNKNKGKTYEEIFGEEQAKELKIKLRESHLGQIPSEKTLIKKSESLKKAHREGRHSGGFKKGESNRKGYKHSEETKIKLKESMKKQYRDGMRKLSPTVFKKGQLSPMKGTTHSEEARRKIRIARAKQIVPIKDTKIEVKIQRYLKQLGYEFFTHQYMRDIEHGYQCDILIPALNLVIECDGDYWHKYPIGLEKDHIRTKELIEKGFKVLRLWECEIEVMNLDDFKEKLI